MKYVVMETFGNSNVGRVRKKNEDQFLIANLAKTLHVQYTSHEYFRDHFVHGQPQGCVLIVADGMGGHAAGDQASSIALQVVVHYVLNLMPWFFRLDVNNQEDLTQEMITALKNCQSAIDASIPREATASRMGTTLTMAYILWPRLYVVHVGDSRCYLQRRSKLNRITKDHTVAQRLADAGTIEQAQVEQSPYSSVLWNAIGGDDPEVSPEVYKMTLEPGDTLLLCTDGLTGHLDDTDLSSLLDSRDSARSICESMVQQACERGGRDNVTAIVARFLESAQAIPEHTILWQFSQV